MTEENKKDYEMAFVLTAPEAAKELADVLVQHQAEIFHQSPLAEARLAYPIKKHASGQFGFYQFRAQPEAINKMRETLLLNPNILRFIIINPPVKIESAPERQERKPVAPIVSNEMLEEKLEEILK